jgi:S1-C subfamily serine protease
MYPPASPDPRPAPDAGRPEHTVDPSDPPAGPRPGRRPGRRRMSQPRRVIVAMLAALAFLAVPAIAGYEVGRDNGGSSSDSATAVVPDTTAQAPSGGGATRPSDGSTGSEGATSSADLGAVADAVDDAVVNINTSVEGGGLAAGTGILISDKGLVLTNNHVISGATSITVELTSSGVTRPARVLGYSVITDIAVIQVQNVANLKVASLGSSSSLDIGETILALGNAGGSGGTPTVVSGTVTGLDQQITASNADGSNSQTLDGLIQLAADIRSGDSGGPVVDTDGNVVGVTVAASVSNSFGFPGRGGGGEGYAIPIEDAVAIAKRITSGQGGEGIRVGATRAVLGVQIQPTLTTQRTPGGPGSSSGSGALVVGVEPGSGAADAGLAAGDTIVALEGETIRSTTDLTRALVAYDPGETIAITWLDSNGRTRTADLELGEGPPA